MAVVTNIEDLRRIAMRRCPRVMFDYVDSGSYDELTRDANRAELAALRFRQRVLVDTTGRSMAAELLGRIIDVILEVCVRREPRVPLTEIAAVTFTEKAAGELQSRLRDRLAECAAGDERESGRRAAARALEEIDRAQVGTIHAFCASLLRERPIEAGLVPVPGATSRGRSGAG